MLFFTHKNYKRTPHKQTIKKRHWFLASSLILVCSWITHTTTASISDNSNDLARNTDKITNESDNTTVTLQSSTPNHPIQKKLANQPIESFYKQLTHKVRKGESLGTIFQKLNFDASLPFKISQNELGQQLVSLSIGKQLTFQLDKQKALRQISYPVNSLQQLVLNIDEAGVINSQVNDLPYQLIQQTASGEITSSLYEAALESGLSNGLVLDMANIFGWDIDFVLDIRKGDTFHVIYNEYHLNGKKLRDGNILAAKFTTQNRTHRAIRYTDDEGATSYYNPEGESMLGTFLRSPVEFSRISSRFGKRKHPILKTWRAHKGVDYAAARGTPIRATANGKVSLVGRNGGYGKTVILKHAGQFSTLYAHMQGFAKGMRKGKRVKQGEVIGYIGSTGRSTGPHLHYEFRVNGTHRNPLTYKTPKASSIAKDQLGRFNIAATQWVKQLHDMSHTYIAQKITQMNQL